MKQLDSQQYDLLENGTVVSENVTITDTGDVKDISQFGSGHSLSTFPIIQFFMDVPLSDGLGCRHSLQNKETNEVVPITITGSTEESDSYGYLAIFHKH